MLWSLMCMRIHIRQLTVIQWVSVLFIVFNVLTCDSVCKVVYLCMYVSAKVYYYFKVLILFLLDVCVSKYCNTETIYYVLTSAMLIIYLYISSHIIFYYFSHNDVFMHK